MSTHNRGILTVWQRVHATDLHAWGYQRNWLRVVLGDDFYFEDFLLVLPSSQWLCYNHDHACWQTGNLKHSDGHNASRWCSSHALPPSHSAILSLTTPMEDNIRKQALLLLLMILQAHQEQNSSVSMRHWISVYQQLILWWLLEASPAGCPRIPCNSATLY